MRIFYFFVIVSLSFFSHAESTLPKGCEAIPVQKASVALKAKHGQLVFIHNISEYDLWITHPVASQGASAGWTSRLQKDNWSALVIDKPSFVLSCIESKPGHEQQIPCAGAIALCQWKKVKITKKEPGSFWVSEDLSLKGLRAAIGSRGYVVPGF
jgi:hypothetical protein